MARPFGFAKFEIFNATLLSSNLTLGANGGYTSAGPTGVTFSGSFHTVDGKKQDLSSANGGTREIETTHCFITSNVALTVNNGDLLQIGGVKFEVVSWELPTAYFGSYLNINLKRYIE